MPDDVQGPRGEKSEESMTKHRGIGIPTSLKTVALALFAACSDPSPFHPEDPSDLDAGELLVVTSVSGPGIDSESVTVSVSVASLGTTRLENGSAPGTRTPLSMQLPAGSYQVRILVAPQEPTRLGYQFYYCDPDVGPETVVIEANRRVVLERSFACTPPGDVWVRTSVTGVDAGLPLKVQLAGEAGVCDLEVPERYDPTSLPEVWAISPIGVAGFSMLRPGRHRLNLCGLPERCPSDRASSVFEVAGDAVTDVLFAIACEERP
jgi:hypothetical protein